MIGVATGSRIKRKFQLTSFDNNNNKFYNIEYSQPASLHDSVGVDISWGRVGTTGQSMTKRMTISGLESLLREKEKKGYKEVLLHTTVQSTAPVPSAVNTSIHPKVQQVLEFIFRASGQHISSYLSTTVEALSVQQVAQGRIQLQMVANRFHLYEKNKVTFDEVIKQVKDYYNVIPTILPRNLRDQSVIESVVRRFCSNLGEQETRLDQLEAAIATVVPTASPSGQKDMYGLLGADLTYVNPQSQAYAEIEKFMRETSRHGYTIRVQDVFEVKVPSERAAFEACDFGAHNVQKLCHGTNAANIRHILHEKGKGSGLRLPSTYANGWMYGPGIYFADVASKSANYCRAQGNLKGMFLADVALGDKYIAPHSHHYTAAPSGYHSVMGQQGFSSSYGGNLQYNEYIVYRADQQTIRYFITWN